jgi:hypothetical protein
MTRAMKSFSALACGSVLIVAGLFGVERIGEMSLLLAGIGLLALLVGAGALLSTQSRAQLRIPHPAVYGILTLAVAFHVFQNMRTWSAGFSFGWFLWALLPYGVVLVLSCFNGTRLPVIAGAALALAADAWNYYEVARSTSSTAAINFIWVPIWNTIIVVPIATFLAWLFLRRRHQVSANAP